MYALLLLDKTGCTKTKTIHLNKSININILMRKIKIKNALLRKTNPLTTGITIPKEIVEKENLQIGKTYDFILLVNNKENNTHSTI